ncbi:MAG: hypothetical protein EA340_07975 [Nitriliruptor sp.]|nr:MAG: hypothetical protein EA340_07975 [Nitriliruptor sp.]
MLPDEGRLIVDAMNALASRPDGWWRDRPAAVERLLAELQPLGARRAGPLLLVVEGRAGAELREGRHGDVEVVHATRAGPDAADDRIVALLEQRSASGTAGVGAGVGADTVVTADRALRDRARQLGARVLGPSVLLSELTAE